MSTILNVEWRRRDAWNTTVYDILSICSIGIVPIITVFYKSYGVKLKTATCPPSEADIVIITKETENGVEEKVSTINHLKNSMNDNEIEHLIGFEMDCIRYSASSSDNYVVYAVNSVPSNMRKYLTKQSTENENEIKKIKDQSKTLTTARYERDMLLARYGNNEMIIPQPNLFSIIVRHALNPIIVFGYFATAIWLVEKYYYYSLFLGVGVIAAIVLMVEATKYNLARLTG
jgi:hypothetical protein